MYQKESDSIYLDSAAGLKPFDSVIDGIKIFVESIGPNPASAHGAGLGQSLFVEKTRKSVAELFKTQEEFVFFTSGATESNALALNNKKVISSGIEHSSVSKWSNICNILSSSITPWEIDSNKLEDVIKKERPEVFALSWLNNELGTSQPESLKEELCFLKNKYGFLVHLDDTTRGIYGGPGIEFADSISYSSGKMGGLPGTGLLIDKKATAVPIFKGGKHELGLRPGTQNILGIHALGLAAEEIKNGVKFPHPFFIRKTFSEFELNGDPHNHILNIRTNFPSELIMSELSNRNIYVSIGSACDSGIESGSKVVSCVFGKDIAKKSLRISLSPKTSLVDCLVVAETIKQIEKMM